MTRKDLESWNIREQAARHFQSLPVLKNLLLCHECMAYWFYDFTGSSVDSIEMELNQQSLKTTTVYKTSPRVFQRCWKLWTNNFKHLQTYLKTLKLPQTDTAFSFRLHEVFSFFAMESERPRTNWKYKASDVTRQRSGHFVYKIEKGSDKA